MVLYRDKLCDSDSQVLKMGYGKKQRDRERESTARGQRLRRQKKMRLDNVGQVLLKPVVYVYGSGHSGKVRF